MAINQPNQNVFGRELYPTLEEDITILIINLTKEHPFHNANKRTAFMTMDITLSMTTKQGIEFIVDVATFSNDNFEELKLFAVQKIKDHTKNEVN